MAKQLNTRYFLITRSHSQLHGRVLEIELKEEEKSFTIVIPRSNYGKIIVYESFYKNKIFFIIKTTNKKFFLSIVIDTLDSCNNEVYILLLET